MRDLSVKHLKVFLAISLIAVIFVFLNIFFETHFYPGTVINGLNVSCRTIETADRRLSAWASSYNLVLKERGDIREQIRGPEIGLTFSIGGATLKKEQNKTPWFLSCFKKSAVHLDDAFLIDEKQLEDQFGRLRCFDQTKIIEPKNAFLLYENGSYKIIKEVYGNKVNELRLYLLIKSAVLHGNAELDLEREKCYENPMIRADSEKIRNTKAAAESYLASRIVYTFQEGSEVIDENEISEWIEFDDDLTITFNTKKIKSYLRNTLAKHYDTYGKTRDFLTSSGKLVKVGGGDYGWRIDIEGETADIVQAVLRGRIIAKEPKYRQRGAVRGANDIGPTYVEINLTKQHLWFYKDGALIVQGAVVTGNINKGFKTPEGIYSLKYRIKNAVLRGEDYQAKVTYWMPFNNDIGIHDASWRSRFGGNIYLTRGSHGCVNAPFRLAETLFQNITVGTPIVCYY